MGPAGPSHPVKTNNTAVNNTAMPNTRLFFNIEPSFKNINIRLQLRMPPGFPGFKKRTTRIEILPRQKYYFPAFSTPAAACFPLKNPLLRGVLFLRTFY
jgi:hypothetical protein